MPTILIHVRDPLKCYYYYLVLPVWHWTEGIHKMLGLYKVLTHSRGSLEAKGKPRTTNTGQILYRKTYSKAELEPHVTRRLKHNFVAPILEHTQYIRYLHFGTYVYFNFHINMKQLSIKNSMA